MLKALFQYYLIINGNPLIKLMAIRFIHFKNILKNYNNIYSIKCERVFASIVLTKIHSISHKPKKRA